MNLLSPYRLNLSYILLLCCNSSFTNTNIIHGLRNITQPIYIFTGKENPENILAANQYQNYLPDTHIVELEKTKRFPHMERPEYFIDNLESLYL